MTAQALPPSLDQQLADARTATAGAQRLANDHEATVKAQRTQVDALVAERADFDMRMEKARNEIARQREIVDQLARQLAELTRLVGAETPIAAFTLAETWQAEKAAYQEEIAELRTALEQIAHRDDAEMAAARTLHYDMRGWARAALAREE